MACVKTPQDPKCLGPDGPPAKRCVACMHKAFVGARRNSLTELSRSNSIGGLALVGRWTENIDTLLQGFHDEFLQGVGKKPPCGYALILCGSASRNEASPYSDLDCAMLIETDDEGTVNYFWEMCRFIGEQIEGLGEKTGASKGLRYCDGGCNPLGLKGGKIPDKRRPPRAAKNNFDAFISQVDFGVELIRTPVGMALLQENKDDHIRESLLETRLCFGSAKLHDAYRQEVATLQGKRQPEFSVRPLLRKRKREALTFLNEVHSKFAVPSKTADTWKLKEHFYRPAQFIAKALAYWYGVDKVATADQVRELVAQSRLTQQNADLILWVLDAVSKVRVVSQLEAQSEADEVWTHHAKAKTPLDNKRQLTADETQRLTLAIDKLVILHQLADEFVRQKTKAVGKRQNPFAAAVNDAL